MDVVINEPYSLFEIKNPHQQLRGRTYFYKHIKRELYEASVLLKAGKFSPFILSGKLDGRDYTKTFTEQSYIILGTDSAPEFFILFSVELINLLTPGAASPADPVALFVRIALTMSTDSWEAVFPVSEKKRIDLSYIAFKIRT